MFRSIKYLTIVFALSQLLLTGCATNPVTGKSNLMLMGDEWDRQIGAQQYQPTVQSQGGEYQVDEELTAYVSEVGQKLAKYSPNELEYEFTVLNSSVPNAWALPGGKIAINRGLLTEINSEAELAAVLGHEIIHAAARHGAQSQSRGMVAQGAMIASQIALSGSQYGQLAGLGSQVGAQLVTTKYGRDAERQSDIYGMELMSQAGYDPYGAVHLQETFVRLSEGRNQDWLSGLFASHPPSQERVDNNKKKAAELPSGGILGEERYQQRIAYAKEKQPAYEAYDKAMAAAQKGDYPEAEKLAKQAISLEPNEGRFYALRGDLATVNEDLRSASRFYDQAMARDSEWFYIPLRRGILHQQMNETQAARNDLERSVKLLPTGMGYYQLGLVEEESGQNQKAAEYYKVASSAGGEIGQMAQAKLQTLGYQ